MPKKNCGILLHITSLPGRFGIGDLGPQAYRFADFLKKAGQSCWQILPLNPPAPVCGEYSPYTCYSAFAGNYLLISPELLYKSGLLSKRDISQKYFNGSDKADFNKCAEFKTNMLKKAFENFCRIQNKDEFLQFCQQQKHWLDDFAMFMAIGQKINNYNWSNWPGKIKNRNESTLAEIKINFRDAVQFHKFTQFFFFRQWHSLKNYCNKKHISIIGDMPIYIAFESSDLWANPQICKLDKSKKPSFIAGVPPDFFSKTGQLWSNPVYDWSCLRKTGYKWWFERIRHNLQLYDIIRLDHFRGFFAYWQVPASHKTAQLGKWQKAPAADFLDRLFKQFPKDSFIAEDLGKITSSVKKYIREQNLTNMKVLQFGFSANKAVNPHHPANYKYNCFAYSGTHDNNTIQGWYRSEMSPRMKNALQRCLSAEIDPQRIHWQIICLAYGCGAKTVIIPMQDFLGLDGSARFNTPSTAEGNWLWRLSQSQISSDLADKISQLAEKFHR